MMESKVFDRTERECEGGRIGNGLYNFIIGAVLCWGFGLNWLMLKHIPAQSIAQISPLVLVLGYLVSCFLGVWLFTKSDVPIVSFIGYNLVVIPFGFVINLVVSQYDPALVIDAVRVTGFVTAVMMLLGATFPAFFQRIVGALTIALVAVIIFEMIEIFFLHRHHGVIDWIVVVIFCGYIGYDWGRANAIPRTVDNAIDSAASLYIDIINLFLRILRIMGRRD